ncbi:hypothetical protein SO694_00081173 [Aureococcus anophagefferens]|uniref:Uncharacterized protein n=1 Tax=Aureococcus anophagefferens TaxID=44056 RepID=A0ABR1G4Y7_AURAN
MTSSKSAGGGMAASKAFFEQRLAIIDEQQTLWNQMHSVTDQLSREEKLTITRAFVAFEMAAFDGFKEAIADVDLPDLVVETAAIATSSAEPPVAEVMQRLLDKYARMRGRDLVGKLMSNLRSAAFAANTHRGGLAAAATRAKKKSRAGERHDAGEDELDVGDVAQIYADLEAEEESLDAEALQ